MPTIILLDVSLSMCRTVKNLTTAKDSNSSIQSVEVKQLANVGIGTLLDYFAQNAQLEYTALIVFSSLWEIKSQFTRHHESIKNGIYDLELYDKSNIVNAVRGVLSLKLHEWIKNGPINIILITDGQLYNESMYNTQGSQEDSAEFSGRPDEFHDIALAEIEGQFDFPCKIQVVCLSSPKDPALKYSIPFYKKLVATVDSSCQNCPVIHGVKNFKQSAIWLPQSDNIDISIESIEELFSKIAELHYKPYHANLSCGHLSSLVMLSPRPTECLLEPLKNEFDDLKSEQSLKEQAKETFVSAINKVRLFKLTDEINICGFMPLKDVASPAVVSRHLILPIVNNKFNEIAKAEQILSLDSNAYSKSIQTGEVDLESSKNRHDKIVAKTTSDCETATTTSKAAGKHSTGSSSSTNELSIVEQDITKQPSFCVLLHNSLKQENMVAICIVGKSDDNDDWYGMLHSHTDSKKRSSLMLSLLTPGSSPILWLPSFRTMGSSLLNADLPQAIRDKISSNKGPTKSYSANSVIWLDPESVQADVQKIVRHAKRGPDKAPHFYKELNRIRRAAIAYGFYDVLFGLAAILEREKRVMAMDQSKSVNKETLDHIDHVIECLKANLNEDSYETNIVPKT